MKRIIALLFAGTVLISCAGPDPGLITNPGSTIPVTIYFLNGYNMSSPNMWFWKSGAEGSQVSSAGTTNIGGYDFIIFKTLAASNTTYGLQFRSGTSYEKALYLFPADRTLTVGTAAIEKYAISYNRQLWDSSLVTKLSNPDNWGMVTNMLGANIATDGTTVYFSIFAPNSTRARVAGEFTSWATSAEDMYLTPDGKYWWAKMSIASPNGKAYKFILDTDNWVCDPYSKANTYANGNSLIMLTNYSWTDNGFTRPTRTDLIIYEVHIKDFTSDSSSGVTASGKYLGVLEKIDYLTNLGINSIEFMPPSEFSDAGYSWGYNTSLFFAPESGYASANTGAQVTEMKQMIDGLHNAGIAVIFDMVYNHTTSSGSENYLWFVDSIYYFDYNNDGDPNNDSTAWGNKVATWRPEVKKLMYDNMKYFMDAFHVDGFRFDSTENMDINSLLAVIDDLITAGYGDRYYICEEFNGSHNSAIQTFNLNNGDYVASWGNGFRNGVWGGLFQTSYGGLGNATYHCNDDGWKKPTHVISYTSSHDEGTLAGRWSATKAKIKLAYAHMMTSMGTPMIWMGDEFMRLHYGNYIAGNTDEANNILDWDLATTNADLVAFVSALIKLRVNNPVLNQNVQNPSGWGWLTSDWAKGSIGYQYIGVSGQRNFVILANFYSGSQIYAITQPGTWYLMCDGTSATNVAPGLATVTFPASTNITVPAGLAYIYMSSTVNP